MRNRYNEIEVFFLSARFFHEKVKRFLKGTTVFHYQHPHLDKIISNNPVKTDKLVVLKTSSHSIHSGKNEIKINRSEWKTSIEKESIIHHFLTIVNPEEQTWNQIRPTIESKSKVKYGKKETIYSFEMDENTKINFHMSACFFPSRAPKMLFLPPRRSLGRTLNWFA